MAKRIYESSRDVILETAKKILIEEGVGHFSTDNLIEKSGLSKGGFFYHFKTKKDLIQALSLKMLEEMDQSIRRLSDKDPNRKGATLRAYLRYSLSKENDEMVAVCRSMVEVAFDKQHDMEVYLKFGQDLLKRCQSEGIPKELVTGVFLTLDGYWYNDVFGYELIPKKDTQKYLKSLIKLTEL